MKIEGLLWPDETNLSPLYCLFLRVTRICYISLLDMLGGQLSLRAMSLVYTTLLSIVPLLALSFSVLKAMGVHNQVEPFLFQFLSPLGSQGIDIGNNIIGFIDNIKVGVLGSVGLGLLIYTVLSLVQKIESAFNMIWHVKTSRSIGERFSNYLSVILIGPVIMVSALGMTATVMSSDFVQYFMAIEPFGSLIILATKLLPYLLVMSVFTFIYMFVPNTRVHFLAAVSGGVIAGFIWQASGILFATFVASSTKYTAIYSSFAVVIMLLIWLYVSWLILLFGANLTFYVQNPSSLRVNREGFEISNRVKERLALILIEMIGQRYQLGKAPYSLDEFVDKTKVPHEVVHYVVSQLIEKKLLIESNTQPVGFLPAKSMDNLLLSEVVNAVRSAEERNFLSVEALVLSPNVQKLVDSLDNSQQAVLSKKTVHELLCSSSV